MLFIIRSSYSFPLFSKREMKDMENRRKFGLRDIFIEAISIYIYSLPCFDFSILCEIAVWKLSTVVVDILSFCSSVCSCVTIDWCQGVVIVRVLKVYPPV